MEKKGKTVLRIIGITTSILLLAAVLFCFLIIEPNFKIKNWQTLNTSALNNLSCTVTLLDDQNNVFGDKLYKNNKIYTSIDEIQEYTKNAFISIEDKRFYSHKGIDFYRIFGALKSNVFGKGFKEGASTITQQLVKNTHLNNEKTLKRKIQEIRIARALERKYDKSEILEMYLNILYFGNNIYGIGSAAQQLFGKPAALLTIDESALLAGMINNPSKYNPYKNYNQAIERRNLVLKRMLDNKKIDSAQHQAAITRQTPIAEQTSSSDQFVNGVLKQAAQIMGCSEEGLFRRKLRIGTTLKNEQNSLIYSSMRDIVLPDDVIEHVIVMDNHSGKIISDYSSGNYNLSRTVRQPGSAIKPFICFAPALENKLIYPCSDILDEPTSFDGYTPSNYKNKYYGYVTARFSLAQSLNVPAVKLMQMCGIERAKRTAQAAGFNFNHNDNSLALALGGMNQGVNLASIANAYQSLANNGIRNPYSYINYIADSDGRILYRHNTQHVKVMGEDTAYLITDMLQTCVASGTAKKVRAAAAAKTGTVGNEKGNSDAYCIAYTPDYTVAVWMGTADRSMTCKVNGGEKPAVVAGNILRILGGQTCFSRPATVVEREVDMREAQTNHRIMLAGADVPPIYRQKELFSVRHLPRQISYNQLPDIFLPDFEQSELDNFQIVDSCAY